jgi:hypothetical protein
MRKFAFSALLLLAVNCWAKDKTVTVKTINTISRSIVPVVCGYIDEHSEFRIAFIAGSGFFVDISGRFITDAHVLDGWDNAIKKSHDCFPAIYIPDQGWGKFTPNVHIQYFVFVGCMRDSAVDLAVCNLIENPFTSKQVPRRNISIVTFDTTEFPPGTPAAFIGFPLQYRFPITSIGRIGGLTGFDSSETGYDYILDKSTWPGASGSPIFLPTRKVIGIIQKRGLNEGSGLAYGRGAAIIVDFLSKHPRIETQTEKKTEQK